MNFSVRFAAGATALALAVGSAGCGGGGGSEAKDFAKQYDQQKTELVALGNELGNAVQTAPGKPDPALAAQFTSFAQRAERIAGKLATLKPPEKAKASFETLKSSLSRAVGDLRSIATAAQAHDATAAKTATESLLGESMSIRSARMAVDANAKK